ncbi:hypothetical protein K8I85_16915, partial [bacterium]|nr:hypothetical protein [bacterium]
SARRLPKAYRAAFGEPIHARLQREWSTDSYSVDAVRAIVQRSHPTFRRVTSAFEEVVADVYHGFLSEVRRAGAWTPDHTILAPLVAWGPGGPSHDGPYTYPAYPQERLRAGIVVLPYSHAGRCLVGWTMLAHETAGHDIVGARVDLMGEIADNLRRRGALRDTGFGAYFASHLEETVSDVLGVLNMGPVAAVAMLAYFRGWNAALGYGRRLSRTQDDGHHPVEAVRPLVLAQTIPLLGFREADDWHRVVLSLARREYGRRLRVGNHTVGVERAAEAARVVAQTIATRPLRAMGRLTLAGIQNWQDYDEDIATGLRRQIRGQVPIPEKYGREFYASHAVAAGVLESLRGKRPLPVIFDRTVEVLSRMRKGAKKF